MDDEALVRALGELGAAELDTIRSVVRALVDRDRAALEAFGAYEHGDPYESTLGWRKWPRVDLVMPDGAPATWEGEAYGVATDDNPWVAVDIRMWTAQEQGPSELVLHLDVAGSDLRYGGMWS